MAKIVAYPVMVLSAVGVLLCLCLFLLALLGVQPLPSKTVPILFGGLFLVWFPTVILMNRFTKDFKQ